MLLFNESDIKKDTFVQSLHECMNTLLELHGRELSDNIRLSGVHSLVFVLSSNQRYFYHRISGKRMMINLVKCGSLHMDEQRQNDQREPLYNSSVPIEDVALKTSWEQWTIETGGERGPGRSVLVSRNDDDG